MMLWIWPMASTVWWLAMVSGRKIGTRPEDKDT
jgi:hypothetical protein